MNFTNTCTQFETADNQYIFTFKGIYPISHKNVSVSLNYK